MAHNTTHVGHGGNEGLRRHRRLSRLSAGDHAHEIMRVEVVARGALRAGVVARAQVPFDDVLGYKTRPVVILGVEGHEVLCLKCTTTRRRFAVKTEYVEVVDLRTAGLSRPTGVERRILRLDLSAITNVLGRLAERDLADLLLPIGIPVAA